MPSRNRRRGQRCSPAGSWRRRPRRRIALRVCRSSLAPSQDQKPTMPDRRRTTPSAAIDGQPRRGVDRRRDGRRGERLERLALGPDRLDLDAGALERRQRGDVDPRRRVRVVAAGRRCTSARPCRGCPPATRWYFSKWQRWHTRETSPVMSTEAAVGAGSACPGLLRRVVVAREARLVALAEDVVRLELDLVLLEAVGERLGGLAVGAERSPGGTSCTGRTRARRSTPCPANAGDASARKASTAA